MTIPRRPVTFENALWRIAGLLGWDGCASAIGKSESHMRKLGAPDTERELSLNDARRLDAAWRRAGGEGAPILECYALALDMGAPTEPACPDRMIASAGKAARETGEAIAAALALATDTGNATARLDAMREIEEGMAELQHLLAAIRATEGNIQP